MIGNSFFAFGSIKTEIPPVDKRGGKRRYIFLYFLTLRKFFFFLL